MHFVANSEDLEEMPHNVSFHQGLHWSTKATFRERKKYNFYLEFITCSPLYHTRRKNPLVHKGLNFNSLDTKARLPCKMKDL